MFHVGQNIAVVRVFAKKSQKKFAELFQIIGRDGQPSSDVLSTYERDITPPPEDLIRDVAKSVDIEVNKFKTEPLNVDSLKAFVAPSNNEKKAQGDTAQLSYFQKRQHAALAQKEVWFPIYQGNTRLKEQGNMIVYEDDPEMQIPMTFVPQDVYPGCDYGERAFGNSMYPRIANQALVIGKVIDKNSFTPGELYGIHLRGSENSPAVIKYVKRSKISGHAVLVSESKSVEPYEIQIDDIVFMFRVLWIVNPA